MDTWEYKVITQKTKGFLTKNVPGENWNEELDALGREGWELVSSSPVSGGSYMTKLIVLYLKRKVS